MSLDSPTGYMSVSSTPCTYSCKILYPPQRETISRGLKRGGEGVEE